MNYDDLPDEFRERVARAICDGETRNKTESERNWARYRDLYMRNADAALAVIYPPAHVGGNAEDCPGCVHTPDLRYPWICPATHGVDELQRKFIEVGHVLPQRVWRDTPPESGICGSICPAMYGGAAEVCSLPSGHEGWHSSKRGTDWGRSDFGAKQSDPPLDCSCDEGPYYGAQAAGDPVRCLRCNLPAPDLSVPPAEWVRAECPSCGSTGPHLSQGRGLECNECDNVFPPRGEAGV